MLFISFSVFKNFDSLCLFFPEAPAFVALYASLDFTFCSCARFPSLSRKENHAAVGRYNIRVAMSPHVPAHGGYQCRYTLQLQSSLFSFRWSHLCS